jgi:hypothetical protein
MSEVIFTKITQRMYKHFETLTKEERKKIRSSKHGMKKICFPRAVPPSINNFIIKVYHII